MNHTVFFKEEKIMDTETKEKNGFDPALRRFRVILYTATIVSLIFCFIPVPGYSQTDRVGELIQELKDEDCYVRINAASALGEIQDTRAVEPLLSALKAKDLAIVAGAYSFFIRRGEQESIPILIDALNNYGNNKMATDFSNCGNSQLKEAARAWAKKHGYTIKPGGSGPQWGSKK
ncbi:HEAT repeat domain-containing protein [bacterium]|nr:HEAT repeat domain-containing protein [bacterium]